MRRRLPTRAFEKDVKRLDDRGVRLDPLFRIIEILQNDGRLPISFRPHKLHGEWARYWECHVGNDWLLVYAVTDREVVLYRTGSHTDIFE
ncbi:type II toxin-antitoxin system YafQ family toxin [Candidatus Kaiserbacteria bacterium]|nr:type II toxin-antitoxin system YafQ family toxin [Candidatus Kaiserbacteria bacterium]